MIYRIDYVLGSKVKQISTNSEEVKLDRHFLNPVENFISTREMKPHLPLRNLKADSK